MKYYPLNPFSYKYSNWTQTYLKELNTKVFALRNYSEFFLTDFIETELQYDSKFVAEQSIPIALIKAETLKFHNYAIVNRDSYIRTDATDINAITFTLIFAHDIAANQGATIYVRPISAGTTIISNARPEGSIDSNGIATYGLLINGEDSEDEGELFIQDAGNTWDPLVFSSYIYGYPNPELMNWRNFILQPTGYASFYSIESVGNGLQFVFNEKGGEEYGNSVDLILMFQNARYNYLGTSDSISFSKNKTGLQLLAKTSTGTPNIATNVERTDSETLTIVPWLSRSNPTMHFTYINRDTSMQQYGEEIICDNSWEVTTTKLENVNTLVYNIYMNPNNYLPTGLKLEAELI